MYKDYLLFVKNFKRLWCGPVQTWLSAMKGIESRTATQAFHKFWRTFERGNHTLLSCWTKFVGLLFNSLLFLSNILSDLFTIFLPCLVGICQFGTVWSHSWRKVPRSKDIIILKLLKIFGDPLKLSWKLSSIASTVKIVFFFFVSIYLCCDRIVSYCVLSVIS